MVRAKNYETGSTFVEVMQKKLWSLFSVHGVQCYSYCGNHLGIFKPSSRQVFALKVSRY